MTRALYEATPRAAARIVAQHLGLQGREGGWLYRGDQPVVQGYDSLARQLVASGAIVARQVAGETRYAIAWRKVGR